MVKPQGHCSATPEGALLQVLPMQGAAAFTSCGDHGGQCCVLALASTEVTSPLLPAHRPDCVIGPLPTARGTGKGHFPSSQVNRRERLLAKRAALGCPSPLRAREADASLPGLLHGSIIPGVSPVQVVCGWTPTNRPPAPAVGLSQVALFLCPVNADGERRRWERHLDHPVSQMQKKAARAPPEQKWLTLPPTQPEWARAPELSPPPVLPPGPWALLSWAEALGQAALLKPKNMFIGAPGWLSGFSVCPWLRS